MDSFGPPTKCPSKSNVYFIEGQIKGVKKGRDQLWVSVLARCSSRRGVCKRVDCTHMIQNLPEGTSPGAAAVPMFDGM